jgi:uncharacterized membrane protein YukC|tara:strand:- start:221 stop:499 length:279 start_codon:yes stop_codon:yes gene_type:complete
MILEIIIGILGLIVAILGYATFNLLQKNEKAEDIIISYRDFILKFQDTIGKTQKRLNQIDEKGMFKSDDEIGWFFNEIKRLQKQIDSFNIDL